MKFEHFAINVPEPVKTVEWYTTNCEMTVVKGMDKPPFMHFLADNTGRVVMEVFKSLKDEVPDYYAQHPHRFHLALAVTDAEGEKQRLLAAGAELFEEEKFDDGTHLVMLRDPWGVPLQLCQRGIPFEQLVEEVMGERNSN